MLPVLNNWKKIWNIRKKNPKIDGETFIHKENYLLRLEKKLKILKKLNIKYYLFPKNISIKLFDL